MERSKRSQSAHNKRVREEADKLKCQGFDVSADIEGFPKPETLGDYKPDIIATKGNRRRILFIKQ